MHRPGVRHANVRVQQRGRKQGLKWALAGLALIFSFTAHATPAHVDPSTSPFQAFERPLGQEWLQANLSSYESLTQSAVDLIQYVEAHIESIPRGELQKQIARYNRRQAFGGWINADPDVNCLDTRNEVLVRDAAEGARITYRAPKECFVVKGDWIDPYSGDEFKTARSMQIDHVVPLKNAYLSGAYKWQPARRCHYANYLENDFHLLAVSGHENMSKGDRGPEDYMPPDPRFQCRYVGLWLRVKAIWELDLSQREAQAIEQLTHDLGCARRDLSMSAADLREQRLHSQNPVQKCLDANAKQSADTEIPPVPSTISAD